MEKKKKKIAHITPVYPPYRGGIGTVAQEYVHGLRNSGWDAHIFVPQYKEEESSEFVHRIKPLFAFGNAAILPRLFKELKTFDLLHLHYPFYGSALIVALVSVFYKIPFVMTYHMQTKASGLKGLVFKLQRWLFEGAIKRLAKTILVSSIDYGKSVGLKEKRLHDMPFWVDEKRFYPIADLSDGQRATFVFVGGLDDAHYFKGVDVLLEAASKLKGDWQLLIVGDGNLKSHYEKLVEEFDIACHVEFLGRVSDEELPSVYRQGSAHILPSIDRSEAFGLVTLEAAASGLPSIVSDLPGVRTLVEHEVTGFIVKPKSRLELQGAMQKIISDQENAYHMGLQARERVQKMYTRTTVLKKLENVYNVSL